MGGHSETVYTLNSTVATVTFTNTSFANIPTTRFRIASVVVDRTSDIDVLAILNRIEHGTGSTQTEGRIRLGTPTPQYSQEFSIGGSTTWSHKQLLMQGYFTSIPAGTYDVEVEVRVVVGTCTLFDDTNGPGSRSMKVVVRLQ